MRTPFGNINQKNFNKILTVPSKKFVDEKHVQSEGRLEIERLGYR